MHPIRDRFLLLTANALALGLLFGSLGTDLLVEHGARFQQPPTPIVRTADPGLSFRDAEMYAKISSIAGELNASSQRDREEIARLNEQKGGGDLAATEHELNQLEKAVDKAKDDVNELAGEVEATMKEASEVRPSAAPVEIITLTNAAPVSASPQSTGGGF